MVGDECSGVFWLVEKQPVNHIPSTEQTIIYPKVVMLCGCHSLPKPAKNPVSYWTISLCIGTRYLDVAMCYLDITKGFG